MSAPRLHVTDRLEAGAEIALATDQSHYLGGVMRRTTGDSVRLFNGVDGEWRARIADLAKRRALLVCEERTRDQTAAPDLTLLFAPVKKARTDFIVEKATELGARVIQPVFTERSIAERVRTDRLQAIAREAAEQTERLDLPEVCEAEKLSRVLEEWEEGRVLIYCDEAGDGDDGGDDSAPWGGEDGRAPTALGVLWDALKDAPRAAALIGPEGGFSPAERAMLRGHAYVIPVLLGPRILRADTAAVAALTLIQAVWGDWS
jgi:16S rRNA (uracil1498-N3)-methyltransferase